MLIYNHKYEGRSNSERGGAEEQFIFFRALFLFSFQLLPFQIRCYTLGVSDIKKIQDRAKTIIGDGWSLVFYGI